MYGKGIPSPNNIINSFHSLDIIGWGSRWVGENESSKYWLLVLNGLKERGLEDVLIFSTDNLLGFSQAIETVYPKAEIHPKSLGKIMYNSPNNKLNKICIIQRHQRANERPKSSIQSTNRRLSLNKSRNL